MQFSSIWPLDRTQSDAYTSGYSGPGSYGKEGVLRIPQSSSIIETSPSDCLVPYPGRSLRGILPLCREAISIFYSATRRGKTEAEDMLKISRHESIYSYPSYG